MVRTKESIISLVVPNGSPSGSVTFTPEPGEIIGCVIYDGVKTNNGFVRARIKSSTGDDLSRLQAIENYRSREASYMAGFKPMKAQGGYQMTYEVIATANFGADYLSELILIYKDDANTCD